MILIVSTSIRLKKTPNRNPLKYIFLVNFGSCQLTSFMFIFSYEAKFCTSKSSSKYTLPLEGLQHMQQCQVVWNSFYFCSKLLIIGGHGERGPGGGGISCTPLKDFETFGHKNAIKYINRGPPQIFSKTQVPPPPP